MALKIKVKEVEFGVGDKIRVIQKIKEADSKSRESFFEGMVIGIKGRSPGKTFTVRRIAEGGIGVERIFPIELPSLEKIVVVKSGVSGVKRAKLYYTRSKSPTEVEMIFKRASLRANIKSASSKKGNK
ncbi:MAG: 50S ribosomal protein L19 [Candidatus Woesebacteria bacterium GW2011_GWA2_40_7b]|uniref:50S ribosomal protein L19 n=1 Tax=Candidatus Woesebacteria bacterium GW2011_GWA2_40_7b TaxID=1618563 RepID=A0A0G0W506_9BACT|nr:MAG: 50S ribosomal protein L19 [Candidatus Woesebacteria bacterium GW2011_GWA2_40_7b]